MPIRELLFSLDGRISRGTFWAVLISLAIVNAVLRAATLRTAAVVLNGLGGIDRFVFAVGLLWTIVAFFATWIFLAICTKRWHDIGRSGWLSLIMFIPLVNLIPLLILGFTIGTVESNRYGDAPGATDLVCSECGATISADDEVCPSCGESFEE
jgi:uncharacterized membrane protein YhaH (DUF805 family)